MLVLYAETDSIYKDLECNVYDEKRNALTCTLTKPAITHPPCQAWSKMKHFTKKPYTRMLAIHAVNHVRKYGGILEHPRGSDIFKYLPKPGEIDIYGGFTIYINQSDFGNPQKKPTGLYIVGVEKNKLPAIPIKLEPAKKVHSMHSSERSKTPLKLALWLIVVNDLAEGKKATKSPKDTNGGT